MNTAAATATTVNKTAARIAPIMELPPILYEKRESCAHNQALYSGKPLKPRFAPVASHKGDKAKASQLCALFTKAWNL